MGIIEIHFHDSEFEFEWEIEPGNKVSRALSFTGGRESDSGTTAADGGADTPSPAAKLRSVGLVALAVGGAIAFSRLRSRRSREATEPESEAVGRRLSLSRSK